MGWFSSDALPGWTCLSGAATGDFQDIDLWRKSVVAGIKLFGFFAAGPVIVPMTFSNRDHFDEVSAGIEPDQRLRVFCLKANPGTVRRRLAARRRSQQVADWVAKRNLECCEVHGDPHFGEPVDTEGRNARDVAAEIINRLE